MSGNNDPVGIDAISRQLIGLLRKQPSSTNRALGQQLDVHETVVAERLRRLIESGTIRLAAVTDLKTSGYDFLAHVSLEPQGRTFASVAQDLAKFPTVMSIYATQGQFGLTASFRIRNMQHFSNLITFELPKVAGIGRARLHHSVEILYFQTTLSSPGTMVHTIESLRSDLQRNIIDLPLDDLDYSIIAELQFDGQVSNRELSRKYGVAAGTIRYRLERLRQSNIMRVVLITDPRKLGASCIARFYIEANLSKVAEICSQLLKVEGLRYLAKATGDYNITAFLVFEDRKAMEEFLSQKLNCMDGVTNVIASEFTESFFADRRWVTFKKLSSI